MGCGVSKQLQSVADDSAAMRRRGPRASMVAGKVEHIADPAAKEAQRVVASNGTVTLPPSSAGYTLSYAYVSQRGYYPDSPDKTNQDAICTAENLGGSSDMHFFGVFDGHGELGTECAQFAQEKLPANLRADAALHTLPVDALHYSTLATNRQLHESPLDDSLSGTTACCALTAGPRLYVANVGDSRAVLAEREEGEGGRLLACELSMDQTPFRPDECLRVLKAGARVLTLDQLEGLKDPSLPCWTSEVDCDGDPPRLWSPAGMYPGTAFTRSIGDSAAESIGVVGEPEITVTELGPHHEYVVLASDGVWEFIDSQAAIDLVSRHSSPYDAAKALVAQAYKLWLQKETRTDDISVVVLAFDWHARQEEQQQGGQQQKQLLRVPSGKRVTPNLSGNLSGGIDGVPVAAPAEPA